jgi:hypothetical protein
MTTDLQILTSIIENQPATIVKPREFFIAWSGVPTLAYNGFSPTLLAIKREIEARVPGIKKENPGSVWPKTTLGALRDDKKLSWEEAVVLRRICDEFNREIERDNVTFKIEGLTVVLFSCRSLERRLSSTVIRLSGSNDAVDHDPPASHLDEVESTMREFSESVLHRYWPDPLRDGNRESHYRADHIEATLVFDLKQQPSYIDDFIRSVDASVRGSYCWFAAESRHMTVRALAT